MILLAWSVASAQAPEVSESLFRAHCDPGYATEWPVREVDGGRLTLVDCSRNMAGRYAHHALFRWDGPNGDEVWSYGGSAFEQVVEEVALDGERLSWKSSGEQRYDTVVTTTVARARWRADTHEVVDVEAKTWRGPPPETPPWRLALLAEGSPSTRWLALPPMRDEFVWVKASLPVWEAAWTAVDALRNAGREEEAALRALAYLPHDLADDTLSDAERARVVERVNDLAFVASRHAPRAAIPALAAVTSAQPDRAVAWLNLADALWACGEVERARKAYRAYAPLTRRSVGRAAARLDGDAATEACDLNEAALRPMQRAAVEAVDAELVVGVSRALGASPREDPAVTEVLWRLRAQRAQAGEGRLVAPYVVEGDVPEGWPVGWDLWFADGTDAEVRPWPGMVSGLVEGAGGELVIHTFDVRLPRSETPRVSVKRADYQFQLARVAETPGGWCGLARNGALWCEGSGPGVVQAPFSSGWVDLASEGERVCGVHGEGYVDCWGEGGPLHLPGVVDAWLGPDGARCLLMAMGALDCEGVAGVPEVVPYPEGLDLPAVMASLHGWRPVVY